MPVPLTPMPYAEDALEPYISQRTVSLHHHEHQGGYVARTNELLGRQGMLSASLEEVVRVAWRGGDTALFNAASQAWNHQFFWSCLTPGGSSPSEALLALIERDFGSLDDLKDRLKEAALAQFGSGWVWLVWSDERLRVTRTSNADSPLTRDQQSLFTLDVWEHAYYLDYQNRRGEYVDALINRLVDWRTVAERLGPPRPA